MDIRRLIGHFTYKKAGVDVDLEAVCSSMMAEVSQRTYANRKGKIGEVEVLEEEGLHRIITINFGPYKLMMNSDGVGTKVEVAERTGNHKTIAYDLLAMLADDSVRYGAEPVAATDTIDVNALDKEIIEQIAEGIYNACIEARISNPGGEIAQLGKRVGGYGKYNYNLGGTILSILDADKMITGRNIKAGDYIIALSHDGFRSNGLSLAREILEGVYGREWHLAKVGEVGSVLWGEELLKPSKIYTKAILGLHGAYGEEPKVELHGIVHVTGGGIPEKLGRVLRAARLGAELNNLYEPCNGIRLLQELGKVSAKEAYKTWHMGQGMLLVVPEREAHYAMDILIDKGIEAKVAGSITQEPGIRIKSKDYFTYGSILNF